MQTGIGQVGKLSCDWSYDLLLWVTDSEAGVGSRGEVFKL